MNLPIFRYHPDPLHSGSVVASTEACDGCGQRRGHLYSGPVYSEHDAEPRLCPWCIADGTAHAKLGATFVDVEAFTGEVSPTIAAEICERTPGHACWQGERWPVCCDDATAFIMSFGAPELHAEQRELVGALMSHIVHELQISGGAATRVMASLDRDAGPTGHLFRCLHCDQPWFHIDSP